MKATALYLRRLAEEALLAEARKTGFSPEVEKMVAERKVVDLPNAKFALNHALEVYEQAQALVFAIAKGE